MEILQRLQMAFILFTALEAIFAVYGMKDRERRKRKKCPRVCLKEISKEYGKLKSEIERLKRRIDSFPTAVAGPRGPRGFKGDNGHSGPPGFPGQKGEPGIPGISKSHSSFELPNCASDEFVTSNGRSLFCVKLDLTSLEVKDNADKRQPSPRKVSHPTVSPAMKDKMAVFERKSMIQSIRGDTWDVGVIKHGGDFYFLSSYLGKNFTIYKWLSASFWFMTSYQVPSARNWKTFTIDGHLFLSVASSGSSYSPVYKFITADQIKEYQQIPVRKVFAVEPVNIGKQLFLVFLSIHGPTSSIYRWSKSKQVFVKHQVVKSFGTGIASFQIGARFFLAFTGMQDGSFLNLYIFTDSGTFQEYRSIREVRNGYALHHMTVGDEHFLAVAKFDNDPSLILRWDGKTFRIQQLITTLGARSFASISSSLMGRGGEETYLAVANSQSNPAIYFYDKKSGLFVKLQEMQSRRTRDVDFFAMGDHVYLVVSTAKNTNIYRGIIKKKS